MYSHHGGDIWLSGVSAGRDVPPDAREEPGGALYVHSPYAPLIVLPSMGAKADVFLHCLTTLVMGGSGLSRSGGNLRLKASRSGFSLGLRV